MTSGELQDPMPAQEGAVKTSDRVPPRLNEWYQRWKPETQSIEKELVYPEGGGQGPTKKAIYLVKGKSKTNERRPVI